MIGLRSVLVVEPADDDRGGVAETLRRATLPVDSVADGARALAGIESRQYAIIVVDPSTPGLSAAALAETLRRLAPRPMVLLVTDEAESVRRLMVADVVHGFLRRGAEEDQLTDLVRDCLAAMQCGTGSQPVHGREAAALRAADGLRVRPT
jgi:CheY-like chemotaxis protein